MADVITEILSPPIATLIETVPTGPQGPAGPTGPAGAAGGETYVHNQASASAQWIIQHNLNRYPTVVVVDSAGTVVMGEVTYIDSNNIVLDFNPSFAGKAYLN